MRFHKRQGRDLESKATRRKLVAWAYSMKEEMREGA